MKELPLKDDATKAAIDFLEKQGYSVVKWIDFDINNKSTHPHNLQRVVIECGLGIYQGNFHDEYTCPEYGDTDPPYFEFCTAAGWKDDFSVSRWCEMPEFKEK